MSSTLLGAAALVFGEVVSFLAPSKFPATFVIAFPPLFNPSFVNFTGFLSLAGFAGSFLGVIVIPFPSTLVVFPSLSVTVVPVGVVTTVFPLSSLTSTLLKLVNSGFNEYANSLPDCLIIKLFPALNVTVSPALISSFD